MIFLFAFGTVAAAAAVEWLAGASGIFFLSAVPFASFAVLWWLDRLPGISRLLCAVAAGFIFDSMLFYPFGTYLICFFLISLAVEAVHTFFSAHDSRSTRAFSLLVMGGLFFVFLPLASALARMLRS